ncbi:uncharacterized protein LOC135398351 [Ornithodoros turicata]|uniref:uncharacterized protein LOC135398351 n=1 Tax=Ornithodoros turicata TaxID=34597 RepID=UPI0031399234
MPTTITSDQGVVVAGTDALLMSLRRLAYPNRLCDLETIFGHHTSTLSSVLKHVFAHIDGTFGHLLDKLNNHTWLTLDTLELFAEAVHAKGAPLRNCWGFVDGTARAICRPSLNQKVYYSGHKRLHAIKFQAVAAANGITCELDGPYQGHRHDAGILRESHLYENLQELVQGHEFVIYGDPAYPLCPLLMTPYAGSHLKDYEMEFNKKMSTVRQAVEWGFGKTVREFAFVDFKKNQKLMLQNVGQLYRVATIFANCHTCLYGSQVTDFFNLEVPALEGYLRPLPTTA